MVDTITVEERSALMSRIRSKNTKPEVAVRSILHALGYRFRLHRPDLPGRPDIALPKHKKIILVQGCFWHGHDCRLASKPKTNSDYWSSKILRNKQRDALSLAALHAAGWKILELWECEIRKNIDLTERLVSFMTDEDKKL